MMPSHKLYLSLLSMMIMIILLWQCPDNPVKHNNNLPDTTSHNFIWEIDTLGDYSGYLNDVWIIDENNIWVVGEIIMYDPDSSWNGTGLETFNAAHWDGTKWELMRMCPQNIYFSAQGIWVFTDNDIWITSNGTINHYNGLNVERLWSIDDWQHGSIGNIWASSPSDIYFVGRKGSIVHYDGSGFRKIESGTTLDVQDIWGAKNKRTGKWEILAIASNDQDKCLLRIQNKTVTELLDDNLSNILDGIWFVPNYQYYVVGAGIHYKSKLDDSPWSCYPSGEVTSYQSHDITGNGINDVFVVGSFCEVVHYNGSTWYNYRNEIPFAGGALGGVSVKDNLVAIAGHIGREAVVIIGRR